MSLVTLDDENESGESAPVIEDEKIDVKVDADDDKTPSERPDKGNGEKKSRKERREETKLNFQAELRRRDEEIARVRAENEQRAREVAEIRGRLDERSSKDGQDDHRQKIMGLRDKANQHLATAHAAGQAGNAQLAKREMDAWYDTQEEITNALADARDAKRQAERGPQEPPAWTQIPEHVQEDIVRVFAEFPWMHTRAKAREATDNLINHMVTELRHPNNYTTFRAAAAQIAQIYGLGGGSTAPNNSQRQRYTGVGSGDGDGGSSSPRTVKMGEHERRMAEARYPQLSAEEAHAKWARDIGSKIRQAG